MEVGEEGDLHLSLRSHHQNDGRFNVSLSVRDKVTRQCPQNTIFEEK